MDSPSRSGQSPKRPSLPPPNYNTTGTPSLAGTKRPAPSLLPAFEPLSSSPALPRPVKRQNTGQAHLKYPTPVPTSSTGILSSSPPRRETTHHQLPPQRPSLLRTATSERAPLSAVPCVELSENGETLTMGRSSNSSHFQLSANKLVSRVHVMARYIPPTDEEGSKIEIVCNGWNGATLHCQGKQWELRKGDSFTSETEGTDVMVDVQNARVMVQWPRKDTLGALSDSSWDDSPTRRTGNHNDLLQCSPLRRAPKIQSPTSPSPGHYLLSSERLQALMPGDDDDGDEAIQIYEDEPELPGIKREEHDVGISMRTEVTASFRSEADELDENDEEEGNPNEENDPIIHSFGPFGANISNRFAAIMAKSSPGSPVKAARKPQSSLLPPSSVSPNILRHAPPLRPSHSPSSSGSPIKSSEMLRKPLHRRQVSAESTLSSVPEPSSPSPSPAVKLELESEREPEVKPEPESEPELPVDPTLLNHIINQLAFARSSSTPLSSIKQHLPSESKVGLTDDRLRRIMEASPTVGTISRSGKDAAGKPLESEYYYVPEGDDDEHRRALLGNGLGKPSLRACRKQHKQYYWKRPKTP